MEKRNKKMIAKTLVKVADNTLSAAANSRCALIYHQPKQPDAVKKFRKF